MSYKLNQFFIGGALLAMAPFFFVGGPDWVSLPLYRSLWDSGHVIFFAFLAVYLHFRFSLASPWRWLWLTLGVFLLGSAIEFLQHWVGREPSILDVWRDVVGLWLGLFWCLAPRKGLFWLRAIASLLVLPTFGLILQAAAAQLNALSKFPLLAGFETALEQLPMNGDIRLSNTVVSQGRYSARVQLNGDKYSGIGISPLVRDWRGYKYLAMDIYVPDAETLTLHVRVSDVQHDRGANAYDDRFNLSIAVQAGWNHLRIPLADMRTAPTQREMNMAAISYVGLFAMQLHKARYFYWDNLYLE